MRNSKKYRPNATGRNATRGSFSMIETFMQKSSAFQSLPASALRVLLWAINKNYKCATKDATTGGKPQFKLTNAEAKRDFGLNSATFTNAKNQLEEKGFLEWVKRGGLNGCNGVCSTFSLSGEWKRWVPPPKKVNTNLVRARDILKRNKAERENAEAYGTDINSVKPARQITRRERSNPINS